MAEAATVEAAPIETSAPEASNDINDILASVTPANEAEAPIEGEPAPEPTEAKPEPGKPKDDPFTDEALATPEGIARARDAVRELQRKHDRAYLKIQEREQKFGHKLANWKQERDQTLAFTQAVKADLNLLRQGDAGQAIEALGRLTSKDPIKVLEEIQLNIARNGKRNEPSPVEAELRSELAQLKGLIEQRAQDEQRAQQIAHEEAFVNLRRQEILTAAADSNVYPHLSRFAAAKAQEVFDHIVEMKTEAQQRGEFLDDVTALQELDKELSQYAPPPQQVKEAGLATSAPSGQKPVQQVRSSPGRSLNPSLAQRTGSVREKTDEDRLAELANDPDFLRNLGLPI
jgi:hypothetical protein